jgi:tryptophan synthase beta chain
MGRVGVLHGNRTYVLQNEDGQVSETHSVSAGLDYPGVGPEHAWLKDSSRASYVSVTDDEALAAFHHCCRIEGIIPALETSHALAYAAKLAPTLSKDQIILINLSGRGDKDINTVATRAGLVL